ncbi:Uncharacterised protein [Serratia quinivorans]|nr:Uncharacterised protein [Serratia quinivorans]
MLRLPICVLPLFLCSSNLIAARAVVTPIDENTYMVNVQLGEGGILHASGYLDPGSLTVNGYIPGETGRSLNIFHTIPKLHSNSSPECRAAGPLPEHKAEFKRLFESQDWILPHRPWGDTNARPPEIYLGVTCSGYGLNRIIILDVEIRPVPPRCAVDGLTLVFPPQSAPSANGAKLRGSLNVSCSARTRINMAIQPGGGILSGHGGTSALLFDNGRPDLNADTGPSGLQIGVTSTLSIPSKTAAGVYSGVHVVTLTFP